MQWTNTVDVTGQFIYAIGRDITEIRELRKFTSKKIIKRCTKIAKIGSWEFDTNNKMIWSKELYSIYEIEAKPHQTYIRIFTHFFQKKILRF
jgi:hypothetical protein